MVAVNGRRYGNEIFMYRHVSSSLAEVGVCEREAEDERDGRLVCSVAGFERNAGNLPPVWRELCEAGSRE